MPSNLTGIRTVFLDFDGTLHESNRIYAPAFRAGYRYLVEAGKAPEKDFSDEQIAHWLGYSRIQMWNEFMGGLETDYQKAAGRIIGHAMLASLEEGRASLYEGAAETLGKLKENGLVLVFLSNCSRQYMEKSIKAFALDQYFDAMICAQDHDYIPKSEILGRIKDRFPKEQVMVGDRSHDMAAGESNGIATVFCEYGYGLPEEGAAATSRIKDIRELLQILV